MTESTPNPTDPAQTQQPPQPHPQTEPEQQPAKGHDYDDFEQTIRASAEVIAKVSSAAHALKSDLGTAYHELDSELTRIAGMLEHARSVLPGSPNPHQTAMDIIAKMAGVAQGIRTRQLPAIIMESGSIADSALLALAASQKSNVNSSLALNQCRASRAEMTEKTASLRDDITEIVGALDMNGIVVALKSSVKPEPVDPEKDQGEPSYGRNEPVAEPGKADNAPAQRRRRAQPGAARPGP